MVVGEVSVTLVFRDRLGNTAREIADLLCPAMDMEMPPSVDPCEYFSVEIAGLGVYVSPSVGVLAVRDRLRELAGVG